MMIVNDHVPVNTNGTVSVRIPCAAMPNTLTSWILQKIIYLYLYYFCSTSIDVVELDLISYSRAEFSHELFTLGICNIMVQQFTQNNEYFISFPSRFEQLDP